MAGQYTPSQSSKVATVLRVTSGNFLEMFDFFLFGFYASYISRAFFPVANEFASLMLTFMTFGAGFLMFAHHAIDEATMLADRVGVMSARPGRFIDLVETQWSSDRDSRIVSSPQFGVYTARIWSTLREESMKLMMPALVQSPRVPAAQGTDRHEP